ncbi:hypothetical protein G6O69_29665 [Pseudenhygromyxa sp. WMMC2535]|nr:hypothetical protein [Pseudenhygromyxa sp. WMMC2535]
MRPLDVLASLHESFVHLLGTLLCQDPQTLVAAISRARGALPQGTLRRRPTSFEIPALVRRAHLRVADMLITVDGDDGRACFVFVVEFQDVVDQAKRWRWIELSAAAAAEFQAQSQLLVFAIAPGVRRWIRGLLPQLEPSPVLVEAVHVDLLVGLEDARRRPLATILGALVHARSETPRKRRMAGIRAALVALTNLDDRLMRRYGVLVSMAIPGSMIEEATSQLRESGVVEDPEQGKLEVVGDMSELGALEGFVRTSYAFSLGEREGRAEVLRASVLDLLEVRGVALTSEARERVLACKQPDQLQRWYELAKSQAPQAIEAQLLSS